METSKNNTTYKIFIVKCDWYKKKKYTHENRQNINLYKTEF